MKSYTFKVKNFNEKTKVNETILSIHMPLEAFFESVKLTPHLKAFSDSNKKAFVTCSDYYAYHLNEDTPFYNQDDLYFCDLDVLVNSVNLKMLFASSVFAGTLPEYPFSDKVDDVEEVFNDDIVEVDNEQVNSI